MLGASPALAFYPNFNLGPIFQQIMEYLNLSGEVRKPEPGFSPRPDDAEKFLQKDPKLNACVMPLAKNEARFHSTVALFAKHPPQPTPNDILAGCKKDKPSADCQRACTRGYQAGFRQLMSGNAGLFRLALTVKQGFRCEEFEKNNSIDSDGKLGRVKGSFSWVDGVAGECCVRGYADAQATFDELFKEFTSGEDPKDKEASRDLVNCERDFAAGAAYGARICYDSRCDNA